MYLVRYISIRNEEISRLGEHMQRTTSDNRKIEIFSFFSGSGFLDLGFENQGFSIGFVNEYHKPFMTAYKYSREVMSFEKPIYDYHLCDINNFLSDKRIVLSEYLADTKRCGKIVGFIGGPPCPDFSIAGKNKGRDGENGKLSRSYIDLIIEQKPDFFLFENVKGLWKTAVHRAFYEELKADLHIAGYATTEHLANALEFGVPQDRDRILLFGVKSEHLHESIFDKGLNLEFNWNSRKKYNLDFIKKTPWPQTTPFIEGNILEAPEGIINELTVEYWFRKNKVAEHPNALDYFTPRSGIGRMREIEEGDVSRKSYKRLHRWRYSPTVAYGNNEVHLHPYCIRRISVAEAMALQSLPADFVLPPDMNLSNKFKTVGNGVPFLLANGIAEAISDFIKQHIV